MRAFLTIPAPMVAYCEVHSVDPEEVAQFVLDEHGRECAELLLAQVDPWDERQEPARIRLN